MCPHGKMVPCHVLLQRCIPWPGVWSCCLGCRCFGNDDGMWLQAKEASSTMGPTTHASPSFSLTLPTSTHMRPRHLGALMLLMNPQQEGYLMKLSRSSMESCQPTRESACCHLKTSKLMLKTFNLRLETLQTASSTHEVSGGHRRRTCSAGCVAMWPCSLVVCSDWLL